MKRTKQKAKETPKRKSGCLWIFLILAILLVFLFNSKSFQKNLDYFLRGEADIGAFLSDMQVSYQTHLTYPDFAMPITGEITSPFGDRINPLTNQPELHTGIDIDISTDNQVKAAASGYISKIGVDERFGNYVILSHRGNFATCYAHLESVLVTEGTKVEKHAPIAVAGNTGATTGPHLHFEIRKGEKRMNPMLFLPK